MPVVWVLISHLVVQVRGRFENNDVEFGFALIELGFLARYPGSND